jgi:hypothetical protein
MHSDLEVEGHFTSSGQNVSERLISVKHAGFSDKQLHEAMQRGDVSAVVVCAMRRYMLLNGVNVGHLYISVEVSAGAVVLTGATYNLKAKKDLISCVDYIAKEVKEVRSVDLTNVINSVDVNTFVADGNISPAARNCVAKLEKFIVDNLKHSHALKVDVVEGAVRVRGRVEYRDEHEQFKGFALFSGRANGIKVDQSGVTTSEFTSEITKPGVAH